MHSSLRSLMQPLNLALLLAWSAVGLSLRGIGQDVLAWSWAMMVIFLVAYLLRDLPGLSRRSQHMLLLAEVASALALMWLADRWGTTPVLLVVLAAQLSILWPLRRVIATVLLIDAAFYLMMMWAGHEAPLQTLAVFTGFQAFALMVGHYARHAELARDKLALINADLLATRALLADRARDAERLRMARDLHDVAGHKLTALTLNLRALYTDPDIGQRGEIRLAHRLSQELLGDIRGVVQAIRDTRELDLDTALRALAAALPRPALKLRIDPDVRITDPHRAEVLLRLVQEAVTNAARHSNARHLVVELRNGENGSVVLRMEDDGLLHGPLREGNGIAGMRERISGVHGTLELGQTPRGGLRIDAVLPA